MAYQDPAGYTGPIGGHPEPPRASPAGAATPAMQLQLQLQLDWSAFDSYGQGDAYADLPLHGEGFGKAAALCIGSRQCQKSAADKGLMCPSFRATNEDLHSTRGRAAALRQALNGELGTTPFVDGQLDAAMDLCVACKGCKRECPNGVDMAALRAETLAQRWAAGQPMPLRTRFFAHLPQWLPRLRPLRWAIALRNRLPLLARAMERTLGVAARRSLPLPAARPFVMPAEPAADSATALREVVLLVDCFATHLEPAVAEAAVALLRSQGYRVLGLDADGAAPLCCGRTAYSAGLIDQARAQAGRLIAALAPHVAAGRAIVGLEPSCLTMLRDEAHQLGLDAEQVQAVAKASLMLEEFLARELDAKRWSPALPAPATAPVLVHGHCHQKAFGTLKAMRKVLGALPGLQVEWIESSCCGMAGSFGYEAEHVDMSMRMAELSLLPAVRAAAPDAWVLASGTSCRHQIQDGAQRGSLHLAQVLQRLLAPATGSAR